MNNDEPPLIKVVLAFAAIYVIWGSTYLAIAFAIESIPPFMMAGIRFFLAGLILFVWSQLKGAPKPTVKQWKGTALSGSLLLIGGNMSVVWAEQYVPSAVAAIIVASVPIWLVLMDHQYRSKLFGNYFLLPGLIIGFSGVIYLALNGDEVALEDADLVNGGMLILMIAPVLWSAGTYVSRRSDHPTNSLLKPGMQMLSGGSILIIISLIRGEYNMLNEDSFGFTSVLALSYLVTFGAILAYSVYVWLVQVRPPSQVGTYAYVNPVVAIILGWFFRDEPITVHTIIALSVILFGVFLVNRSFK